MPKPTPTRTPRTRAGRTGHAQHAGRTEVKLALAAAAVASTVGGWAAIARAQPPPDEAFAEAGALADREWTLAGGALTLELPPVATVAPLAPLPEWPAIDPLPPLVRAIEPRLAGPLGATSATGSAPPVPPRAAVSSGPGQAAPPMAALAAAPQTAAAAQPAVPAPAAPAPAVAPAAPAAAPRVVVVPTPRPATGKVAATTRSSR
ncbi:MAG TPA: hypothetical protein VFX49_15750 [Chloroflexota bacterium]|nr:hypothetical protein [Chloroflexota bacterium]